MRDLIRRSMLIVVLLSPTACASRAGWEAAMMGGMVVGGLVLGRGAMMHGGHGGEQWSAADVDRFQPGGLLERREELQLSETQVIALDAVLQDRRDSRRTPDEAAQAAYGLLTPDQRAAVRGSSAQSGHH